MVIVCRAPRQEVDPQRLLAIYRTEPTPRLVALRRALQTERDTATTPDVVAWCDVRLPLVDEVLRERGAAAE